MSCRRVLRKTVGVLFIVFGVGVFALYLAMESLYPPMDTDIESILDGEISVSKTVRVRGTLSESSWTVMETEEKTGKFRGIRRVYRLKENSGGEILSILVVSDKALEKGDNVLVEGRLRSNAYDLPGYVVDVPEAPPIPMVYLCAGVMLVSVLLGITVLILKG
jgi:hypothetical protein